MNYYSVLFEFDRLEMNQCYSARSKESLKEYLRECGVAEEDIKRIAVLPRMPRGKAVEEIYG